MDKNSSYVLYSLFPIGDARINVGEFDPVVGNITWFIEPSSLWPGMSVFNCI
jgi:hypothetical protein